MPLTREQTKYQSTNDTVFFPTVAIDRNLAVRGSTNIDGTLTVPLLGINTKNPTSTLHVAGSIRLDTEADGQVIKLFGRSSDNFSQIATRKFNSSIPLHLLQFQGDTAFAFVQNTGYLSDTTNFVERMRIDSSGNVGIGISPSYKLQVSGTSVGAPLWANINNTDTTAGSTAGLFTSNGTVNNAIYSTSNAAKGVIGTTSNHPLELITNNTTRMTIAAAGSISTPNSFNVTNLSNVLLSTDSGGSISMGRTDGTATSPYIDFNSGATAVDYDARIQASGGTGTSGQGTLTISGNLIQNVNTTAKTGAYTLNYVDANTLVQMNGAFAFTVPLNSTTPFATGTTINLLALTSGVSVTFTGGITSYATPGTKLRAAGSMATLIKLGTDTWVLSGDLTA